MDARTPGRLYTAQIASESQLPSKQTPYSADQLLPSLWNSYTRLTFLNKRAKERVTVDMDLYFQWGEQQLHFPGLVVAEVK
ncbi:MAG: hypothetical protein DCC55_34095 [Chloroflexi bacterium]|nr:MAG: hypothetical protein DCC55_34095 [Chloroflexota bacterium]